MCNIIFCHSCVRQLFSTVNLSHNRWHFCILAVTLADVDNAVNYSFTVTFTAELLELLSHLKSVATIPFKIGETVKAFRGLVFWKDHIAVTLPVKICGWNLQCSISVSILWNSRSPSYTWELFAVSVSDHILAVDDYYKPCYFRMHELCRVG